MQNRSESGGKCESRPGENGAPEAPSAQPGPRPAQPWGLAFALFLLGFVALIVLSKTNLSHGLGGVLRVLAAALCVSAFLIARRAQKPAR